MSDLTATELQRRLRAAGDPQRAALLAGFFKTGPGQYGEGDVFLGLRVPEVRRIAQPFIALPLAEVAVLLRSAIHEERLAALVLLVMQAGKADETGRRALYEFYLAETRFINNWDLVDLSAPQIVGAYLAERDRAPLRRLARSPSLWERRISIVATHAFIRRGETAETLAIARLLLGDAEDLIHKAVGWMLREVGKRDTAALERFLDSHGPAMPRTMLRYAIERFPPQRRREYLRRR